MKHVNKCLTSRKFGGGVRKVNNWFLITIVSTMVFWRQYYDTLSQCYFISNYLYLFILWWRLGFCFSVLIVSIVIPGCLSLVLYFPSLRHSKCVPSFPRCLIDSGISLAVESMDQALSGFFKTAFSYQNWNNGKTLRTVLRFVKIHLQKVYINDK